MPLLYKGIMDSVKIPNHGKQNARHLYMPVMSPVFLFLIQYMGFFLLLYNGYISIISTVI